MPQDVRNNEILKKLIKNYTSILFFFSTNLYKPGVLQGKLIWWPSVRTLPPGGQG